ncbi:MAG TPA: sulfite exporter TauE/SafE family protein [Candidatus Limnocylindria bacterium]|nr:sulfite exporter TauE/SafE family protein [Candidatus Limnocylindria bacterium]
MKTALLAALAVVSVVYIIVWVLYLRRSSQAPAPASSSEGAVKLGPQLGIGFFTNLLDTLGIGSFALTSSMYKLLHAIPDDEIPGTLNVGHALPTIAEALIFVAVIAVDLRTLVLMIAAAVLGAWFGAGIVSGWPKRRIQIGLALALLAAAMLMLGSQLGWFPVGGDALGLTGPKLWIAVGCNFMFGAFMQLGVGLYAPCMILIYLMGMNPRSAFPIMMGSCAFLMPVGGYRFIRTGRYSPKAALGLAIGGIPGVLLAAYVIKELPLKYVRWVVVFAVLYTAVMLLRSAVEKSRAATANAPQPAPE